MAYPKDRFTAIELDTSSFWGAWHITAREKTLPSLLSMLKNTGRWEMWDLQKRGGLYDAAGKLVRRLSLLLSDRLMQSVCRLGSPVLGERLCKVA